MKQVINLESTEAIGRKVATSKNSADSVTTEQETSTLGTGCLNLTLESEKKQIADLFLGQATNLKLIENRVSQALGSDAKMLTEISDYLLKLGGKRIRPILALLSSSLFGHKEPSEQLVEAVAGIELIHMATLLHDDIIDKSMVRRHSESAFSKYGLTPTLLAGDFLLVKAFGMCARLDSFIIERTEKACIELTEGELLEGHLSLDRDVSLEEYRDIIEKKTASLFNLACAVGAHFAGANEKDIELISRFGNEAGVLFQMVDDVLDVTADKDLLGKPAGIDLRQKTPTLPNILWLRSGDANAINYFSKNSPSTEEAKQAMVDLKEGPTIKRSMEYIDNSKNICIECLEGLSKKDDVFSNQLKSLLNYTISRIPQN